MAALAGGPICPYLWDWAEMTNGSSQSQMRNAAVPVVAAVVVAAAVAVVGGIAAPAAAAVAAVVVAPLDAVAASVAAAVAVAVVACSSDLAPGRRQVQLLSEASSVMLYI